ASGTPLEVAPVGGANIVGRTYREIVQDMVDAYAWAQWDGSQGGGWRYSANQAPDNSACQWAAIGMIAAERVWGLTVPQWVKDWNLVWLAYSQNSQGWFGYTYSGDAPWGAYATTPSGMVQMALDGVGRDMAGAPSWNKAETWIRDRFGNTGGATQAIKSYYYGLFSFVKSMLLHPGGPIVMLRSQTAGVPELDWYAAEVSKGAPTDGVARTLVSGQSSGGYWWGHNYSSDQYPFETAWAVMMLHQTLFETGRPVAVPRGIPNPAVAGQIITLDGSDSFHQDGTKNIVGWDWDLDNNGTFDASGVTVTTTFGAVGNYPVKLRVTDDSVPPMTAESTMQMVIATPPVAPTAVAGGPYVFCPQAKPWFLDGLGSINPDEGRHELGCDTCPGDTIREYAWDLDGDRDFNDAFGPTPDVTDYFTTLGPGGYNILLRVTDNTSKAYPSSTFPDLASEGRSQVIVRESSDPGCACSNLTGAPDGKKAVLEWTALQGASFYNVYRSLTAGGPYLWIAATSELTYTDVNVISEVEYYYVVRPAALNGNELCQSNEVMVVPVCDPAVVTCTPTQKVSNSAKYYRELGVTSACYGRMQMRLYVGDTLNPSFVSGPYWTGNVLRVYTGRPASKATASTVPGVAANIEVKGKMLVWSVDPLDVPSIPIISP
ncbi:MAG: PKD domain-containing protein, partial [Akkermansiaceae bacterium]|nr:PKD domain-containing protein [Akkermansiaceae bacterium]